MLTSLLARFTPPRWVYSWLAPASSFNPRAGRLFRDPDVHIIMLGSDLFITAGPQQIRIALGDGGGLKSIQRQDELILDESNVISMRDAAA